MTNRLIKGNSLEILRTLEDQFIDLIYVDPPFGTQNHQVMERKKNGKVTSVRSYSDIQKNYLEFIVPYLHEFKRLIKTNGTVCVHLDYRWVHYVKVELDKIFGIESFLNEIIWSYNFGGRGKNCWPKKHDTILVYVNNPKDYTFNYNDIDRIPYIAPELQYIGRTKEEAEKRISIGQIPTDVWNMNIVGTNAKERVGYPNQKPLTLLKRIISTHSNKGETVLDCFGGSGTTAVAASELGRNFMLIDNNDESIAVTAKRLQEISCEYENV